jgi:hypothetical protein
MQEKSGAGNGVTILAICAALIGMDPDGASARTASYITFDLPDCPYTNVSAINIKGDVAGECEGDFGSYGFVRTADGTIQTLDIGANETTTANGLNRKGEVAGSYYSDKRGGPKGFLRKPGGNVQNIKPRKAADVFAWGINDSGEVVGRYTDVSNNSHAFVRSSSGDITSFDVPGANGTFAFAIDNSSVITGTYADANRIDHGFIRFPDGSITAFDPPGSINTFVQGLNNNGAASGYFIGNGGYQGFIRNPDGTFTTFFAPEDGFQVVMTVTNDKGVAAGQYNHNGFPYHAFLRKPNGSIVNIDVPGAASTYAQSINRSDVVAGAFEDEEGVGHGFIRIP